jgi:organic radical activating enzyme
MKIEQVEMIAALLNGGGGEPICDTIVCNMWGEPFLNPDILPILDRLTKFKLIFSTNLNFNKQTLAGLIDYQEKNRNITEFNISMDGYDKESYENYYRIGGSFEKIMENLQLIKNTSLQKAVLLQWLDSGDSEKTDRFVAFANEHRFRPKIKPMDKSFNKSGATNYNTKRCHYPYLSLPINADLDVISCCSDPRSSLKIRNLDGCRAFKDVFNGAAIRERRLVLASNKNVYEVCRECQGITIAGVSSLPRRLFRKALYVFNRKTPLRFGAYEV